MLCFVNKMKKIKLTKSKYTVVDNKDYEYLSQFKWFCKKDFRTGIFYAARSIPGKTIFMHRIILKTPIGKITDHIDGDGLNNLRNNLRIVAHCENSRNRGVNKNNTSGIKGVYKRGKKWVANIRFNYKLIHLATWFSKEEAMEIRKKAVLKYFKQYARS